MHRLNHLTRIKYHLLTDGRILAFQEFGDPNGTPTFYCHTTAGSNTEGELFHQSARKYRIRLICIDRPGFGDSSYLPKRTLLDYPKDLLELANELGISRFGLIGWTGGSAYALAVTHEIPDKVIFCIIIASFCDFRSESNFSEYIDSGIDKLIADNHRKYPKLVRFYLNLVNTTSKSLSQISLRALVRSVNSKDRAIVTAKAIRSIILKAQKNSFKDGPMGPTKEILIHYSDWGFQLANIKVFIDIFHGAEDQIVPLFFSQHLHKHIPKSKLNIIPEQGHFFPCISSGDIFALAAERANYCQTNECHSRELDNRQH